MKRDYRKEFEGLYPPPRDDGDFFLDQPPKKRRSVFVRFLYSLAFLIWLIVSLGGSAFVAEKVGLDMNQGRGIAIWIAIMMMIVFAPALIWDRDHEGLSLRAVRGNVQNFKGAVTDFCKLVIAVIGVVLGGAGAVFVLGGVVGLLIFGWRQLLP